VKHQLSQEEHDDVAKGKTHSNPGDMSPSEFIVAALELEDVQ
jgi:hypothetical protein